MVSNDAVSKADVIGVNELFEEALLDEDDDETGDAEDPLNVL